MSQSKRSHLDHRQGFISHKSNDVNRLQADGDRGSIAIVLDTANWGASAAALGGRPPYASLLREFTNSRQWIGTAVVLAGQHTTGINAFARYLRGLELSVIVSYRREVFGRTKTADDVVIAAEAACALSNPAVGELMLCTGDGDLAHVIEIAHRLGKPCTVAAYGPSLSSTLRNRADRVIELGASDIVAEAA